MLLTHSPMEDKGKNSVWVASRGKAETRAAAGYDQGGHVWSVGPNGFGESVLFSTQWS